MSYRKTSVPIGAAEPRRCRQRVLWRWALLLSVCGGLGACTNALFERAEDAGGGKKDVAGPSLDAVDAPVNTRVCAPGEGDRSKSKAQACACDNECQSGHCADGVCCSSSCGEPCKACNLPSALGDCVFVPAGVKPSDSSICAPSTPRTCSQDGTCDGKGGCRLWVAGTECKAGHCDGDRVADVQTCDGSGHCSETASQPCWPYTCDSATDRCAAGACTSNAICAEEQECLGGRCGPSPNGAVCESSADCSSGFCVDGVCCNIACGGDCMSCKETGSLGRCTNLAAGVKDTACAADEVSTCGHTGLCDGAGACALYPENTPCGPSSCSGGQQNAPRTCDGQGTCRSPQLIECAPYLCSAGACQTSCDPNRSGTCAGGNPCVATLKNGVTVGVCGLRSKGQPCSEAADCQSGACVDGVCCENACTGPCRSCNLAGSPGSCLNVAANAADPRGTCQDLGADRCSTNGLCDGKGACQLYSGTTACGVQSCAGGTSVPRGNCTGLGSCQPAQPQTCHPYACNGDTCYLACSTNAECAPGALCTNGSCGLKPPGARCAAGNECSTGFCAQGVCCNGACTAACMACDLVATPGTCTAVADGQPDPQGKCKATEPALCGTTGACRKGACAYYQSGLNCAAAVCATSASVTPPSTCDGSGACRTPAAQSCGAFTCAEGACKSSCTKATEGQDCNPPNTCTDSSCGLKVNGAACTSPVQCQSRVCTEGVCCNSSCTELCKTCKPRNGQAGTCTFVEAGGTDPSLRCATTECSTDGSCNGAGACQVRPAGIECRPETCAAGVHTLSAKCGSGSSACPQKVTASCGDYICKDGRTCFDTCSRKEDCSGDNICFTSTVPPHCGKKLGPGEACTATAECATGVCGAEHVCCDQVCDGSCQTCVLSPKGTCVAKPGGTSCSPSVSGCPPDAHMWYTGSGICTGTTCDPVTVPCEPGTYDCNPSTGQCEPPPAIDAGP